jgi:hypothetical protein
MLYIQKANLFVEEFGPGFRDALNAEHPVSKQLTQKGVKRGKQADKK